MAVIVPVLMAVTMAVIVLVAVIVAVFVIAARIVYGVHAIQDARINALPHIDKYQVSAVAN